MRTMSHSASLDISFHPGNLYPSTIIRALLFSVLANVARRTLERAQNFTDLSWYVERILPALSSLHQDVESLTASEHV
jgi:hypothetical protein